MRLAAVFLALALGRSFAAAAQSSKSSFVAVVDPRVELLGVVQYLAGSRNASAPAPSAYIRDAERAFGRFRGAPVVKLYREMAGKYQEFGVDVLFLTDPPELRQADGGQPPPFGGGAEDFERFLSALRAFASDSGFAAFYEAHREYYARLEEQARRETDGRDFPAVVESYVGKGLDSHCRYVLSPLFSPKRGISYIIPYPDPEHRPDQRGPFEVDVILTPEKQAGRTSFFGSYRGMLLDELIYVFVERTYFPYAKEHLAQEAALFGALGGCGDRDCLKDLAVRAVGSRLAAAACSAGETCAGRRGKKTSPALALFAGRLAEYEAERARYPSLDAFYARLFAVPGATETARATAASVTVP